MILECSFCIDYIFWDCRFPLAAQPQKNDRRATQRSAQIRKRIMAMSPLQSNNVDDTDTQKEKKKKHSAVRLASVLYSDRYRSHKGRYCSE